MKWKGRRASTNVVDSRGRKVANTAGAAMLLNMVGRRFGIKGILILIVVGAVAWKLGLVDPGMLTGGPSQTQSGPVQASPEEEELFQFVKVVLADTEDIWTAEFARHNQPYKEPQLEIYRGQIPTACGTGVAQMGPFYCPGDQKVYIDLGFYDELDRTFQAPGDFAQAYVIAHEVGHHIQTLLGTSQKVHARRGQPDFNEVVIAYEPDRLCVESKSLKLYLWTFRDEPIFGEGLASVIARDLFDALEPHHIKVTLIQNVRGGLQMTAVAELTPG